MIPRTPNTPQALKIQVPFLLLLSCFGFFFLSGCESRLECENPDVQALVIEISHKQLTEQSGSLYSKQFSYKLDNIQETYVDASGECTCKAILKLESKAMEGEGVGHKSLSIEYKVSEKNNGSPDVRVYGLQ
jgi:hypothetical protein